MAGLSLALVRNVKLAGHQVFVISIVKSDFIFLQSAFEILVLCLHHQLPVFLLDLLYHLLVLEIPGVALHLDKDFEGGQPWQLNRLTNKIVNTLQRAFSKGGTWKILENRNEVIQCGDLLQTVHNFVLNSLLHLSSGPKLAGFSWLDPPLRFKMGLIDLKTHSRIFIIID